MQPQTIDLLPTRLYSSSLKLIHFNRLSVFILINSFIPKTHICAIDLIDARLGSIVSKASLRALRRTGTY